MENRDRSLIKQQRKIYQFKPLRWCIIDKQLKIVKLEVTDSKYNYFFSSQKREKREMFQIVYYSKCLKKLNFIAEK